MLKRSGYKGYNEKCMFSSKSSYSIDRASFYFLGYLFSDNNIQQILKAITCCLDHKNIHKTKSLLIFVE
ncbi:hypothetical protein [Bacillus cereus]